MPPPAFTSTGTPRTQPLRCLSLNWPLSRPLFRRNGRALHASGGLQRDASRSSLPRRRLLSFALSFSPALPAPFAVLSPPTRPRASSAERGSFLGPWSLSVVVARVQRIRRLRVHYPRPLPLLLSASLSGGVRRRVRQRRPPTVPGAGLRVRVSSPPPPPSPPVVATVASTPRAPASSRPPTTRSAQAPFSCPPDQASDRLRQERAEGASEKGREG